MASVISAPASDGIAGTRLQTALNLLRTDPVPFDLQLLPTPLALASHGAFAWNLQSRRRVYKFFLTRIGCAAVLPETSSHPARQFVRPMLEWNAKTISHGEFFAGFLFIP